MIARKLFIAGATGVTGRAVLAAAVARGVKVVPQVRPKSAAAAPQGAAVVDLADAAAMAEALVGVTTIVQCIGTMKKRFAAGDTYQSSDIGTTQCLVDAARFAAVDHIVLLSSVGAGKPMGAYLKAKARAEAIVVGSGLAYTIFRPSVLLGEGRSGVPGMGAVTRLLGMKRYQPIQVDDLARAILHAAVHRGPLGVALEGRELLALVAQST